MALINVTSVKVLDNPAPLTSNLKFGISFECLKDLKEDVEWKIVYLGSVKDTSQDQQLDAIDIGPLTVGTLQFEFEAPPPDYSKMPADEIMGVTAIMLIASYKTQEFISIGYYVNVNYTDQDLADDPPHEPIIAKLQRNIVANEPRITRTNINWDDDDEQKEDEKKEKSDNSSDDDSDDDTTPAV